LSALRVDGWLIGGLVALVVPVLVGIGAREVVADRGAEDTGGETAPVATPATPQTPRDSVLAGGAGMLTLADRRGDLLVGLGVRPGGRTDVVVIPSDQRVLPPSAVETTVDGRPARRAGSCGKRCYRFATGALRGRPRTLVVGVTRGPKRASVAFRLPARTPPPAPGLLARAHARMFALDRYRVDETLSSGAAAVDTLWTFVAPNRMRYDIRDGDKAVVIGNRRWDFTDGRWSRSPPTPVSVPQYIWQTGRHPRLLGTTTVDGKRARVLSLYSSGVEFPTWFVLDVGSDDRVLRARMLTTAHFMRDDYVDLNGDFRVTPPVKAR